MEDLESTDPVDAAQADLELRLARLWSSIELLDRYSWRVLEGVVVDEDARAALTAAYTSATAAARSNGLSADVSTAVRSTLTVVAAIEEDISWAAKRWVEYATTALVCRALLDTDRDTDTHADTDTDTDTDGPGAGEPLLVGGDFGWVEYEILTCTWRSVVGELHPDDPPMVEDPSDEADDDEWWLGSDGDVPGESPETSLGEHRASPARERVDTLWEYLTRPLGLTLRRARTEPADDGSRRLAVATRRR